MAALQGRGTFPVDVLEECGSKAYARVCGCRLFVEARVAPSKPDDFQGDGVEEGPQTALCGVKTEDIRVEAGSGDKGAREESAEDPRGGVADVVVRCAEWRVEGAEYGLDSSPYGEALGKAGCAANVCFRRRTAVPPTGGVAEVGEARM